MPVVFRRWLPWAALCAAITGAVWALGAGSWLDLLRGMRPPTEAESFYRYVAQQLEEQSICDKISWTAESPGGFFLAASYERSECYTGIAEARRDPWLCLKVRRLGVVKVWEDQLTPASCFRRAEKGGHISTGVSDKTLLFYFGAMGYDVDTLHLEGVTPPVIDVRDVYRAAAVVPDVAQKVATVRNAATGSRLDAEDLAYLLDMVALADKNADVCMEIPEELLLATQKQRFRDWCLFKLATNTHDASVCRRIPVRPDEIERYRGLAPRTAAQMTTQAQCDRQATTPYPIGRYSAEVPGDEARIRRLLALLDVEIPKGRDLPAQRVAQAYQLYLDQLDTRDSTHLAARQRLIDRVLRLEAR
jgi:hypothetical protein